MNNKLRNIPLETKSFANSVASTQKYRRNELPWDMKIAMMHPIRPNVYIFSGGDLGHVVKKQRNAARNSGIPSHKRELMLHGMKVSLSMLEDVWRETPDHKDESAIMIFRKIKLEVFDLNANTMLRTPHAMKVYSQSMLSIIEHYKSKNRKAPAGAYDSWIEYIKVVDRFVDVMNGTRDKGCELIDGADHPHVFELLDTVKFFTEWRNEVVADDELDVMYNFLPSSSYEDTVWTCMGIVGVARKQLRRGHKIVQRRHGSDVCEHAFCAKRSKNANADAFNTNHILARYSSTCMNHLAASRKANFGSRTTFFGRELDIGKIKRLKVKRKGSKSIHR